MFKDFFFNEEQRICSSKNRKNIFFFLMFKDFLMKNEGFGVLKTEKIFFLDV